MPLLYLPDLAALQNTGLYCRLIQNNNHLTLKTLKRNKELLEPCFCVFHIDGICLPSIHPISDAKDLHLHTIFGIFEHLPTCYSPFFFVSWPVSFSVMDVKSIQLFGTNRGTSTLEGVGCPGLPNGQTNFPCIRVGSTPSRLVTSSGLRPASPLARILLRTAAYYHKKLTEFPCSPCI